MTEPTITCPSLHAAPPIDAARKQVEQQLLQKNHEIARREHSIRETEQGSQQLYCRGEVQKPALENLPG